MERLSLAVMIDSRVLMNNVEGSISFISMGLGVLSWCDSFLCPSFSHMFSLVLYSLFFSSSKTDLFANSTGSSRHLLVTK